MLDIYIKKYSDYRSGTTVSLNTEKDRFDEDDIYGITQIQLNKEKKYNVYLIIGTDDIDLDSLHLLGYDDLESAENILEHLYSDINNMRPFVVTGMTCAYKEEGYYPEPFDPIIINDHPLISKEIKQKIDEYNFCVAVIIDYDNDICNYILIQPLF